MKIFFVLVGLFCIHIISYLLLREDIRRKDTLIFEKLRMRNIREITSMEGASQNIKLVFKRPEVASKPIWLTYSISAILYLGLFAAIGIIIILQLFKL